MPVDYQLIRCKSVLHHFNKRFLPFRWGVNPYRGCEHSCPYCFARYTHKYLGYNTGTDFENTIFVKVNAAQVLAKELSRSRWTRAIVNLGSVCDPYQPAEKRFQITRQLLEAFARHRNPLFVSTKSNLILRDLDLLSRLAQTTLLRVNFTITTLDDHITRIVEPRAPSTSERLTAIQHLAEAGIDVNVLFMPIFPYLTDKPKNIHRVVKAVRDAGAVQLIPGVLYLRTASRTRFLSVLNMQFPELLSKYRTLYKRSSPSRVYTQKIYRMVAIAQKQYRLNSAHVPRDAWQTNLGPWLRNP